MAPTAKKYLRRYASSDKSDEDNVSDSVRDVVVKKSSRKRRICNKQQRMRLKKLARGVPLSDESEPDSTTYDDGGERSESSDVEVYEGDEKDKKKAASGRRGDELAKQRAVDAMKKMQKKKNMAPKAKNQHRRYASSDEDDVSDDISTRRRRVKEENNDDDDVDYYDDDEEDERRKKKKRRAARRVVVSDSEDDEEEEEDERRKEKRKKREQDDDERRLGEKPKTPPQIESAWQVTDVTPDYKQKTIDLLPYKTNKTPVRIRLSDAWIMFTDDVHFKRGDTQTSFEVIQLQKPAKDEKTRNFTYNLPISKISFFHDAVRQIHMSCPSTVPQVPSVQDMLCMNKGSDGTIDMTSKSGNAYTRALFRFDTVTVQIMDVTYKNSAGGGTYEAMVITKKPSQPMTKDGKPSKAYSVSLPTKLVPNLVRALEYTMHVRGIQYKKSENDVDECGVAVSNE